MKKREFNKVIKQLMDKETKLLSLEKIAALDVDTKDEIVHFLVRERGPIIESFISPNISWEWLYSMGYLNKSIGEYFTFIHTSAQTIK